MPFGGAVGHAVPLGYEAYAVVPIAFEDASETDYAALILTDAVVEVLGPFTGEQAVHCGVWEGWPWWYPTGGDPSRPQGTEVGIAWPEGASPTQAEIDRALAEAREHLAADSVEFSRRAAARAPASALLPGDRATAIGDGAARQIGGPAIAGLARGSLLVSRRADLDQRDRGRRHEAADRRGRRRPATERAPRHAGRRARHRRLIHAAGKPLHAPLRGERSRSFRRNRIERGCLSTIGTQSGVPRSGA